MSETSDIDALIDQRVRNYPVQAFQDMWMNTILHRINRKIGSGGGSTTEAGALKVTSADFTTSVNCPIPSLNGFNLAIFWNDTNKFLDSGTDFTALVGGGFTMLVPGFNSASAIFTFYVFIQTN